MPVIVIGADTPEGAGVVDRLVRREGEVRVFVSDHSAAGGFRGAGIKVAVGDVSDSGHVEAAMMGCFAAVLLTEAATDARERSFARTRTEVLQGWREALGGAGVHRAIWVAVDAVSPATPEHTVVGPHPDLPSQIAELDQADSVTWPRLAGDA